MNGLNKLYDAMYLVAKKELSDRNWQRQKQKNAPNIPEGTKFFMCPHQMPKFKFVTLKYKDNFYLVKASDLEVVEAGYYSYKDGENRVW